MDIIENIFKNQIDSLDAKIKKDNLDYKQIIEDIHHEEKKFNNLNEIIKDHIDKIEENMKVLEKGKQDLLIKVAKLGETGNNDNNLLFNTPNNESSYSLSISKNIEPYDIPNKKLFICRKSILTDLLQKDQNFQTMYNICLAILIITFLRFIASLYLEQDLSIQLGKAGEIIHEHILNLDYTFNGLSQMSKTILITLFTSFLQIIFINIVSKKNKIKSINRTDKLNHLIIFSGIILIVSILVYYANSTREELSMINNLIVGCEILRNAAKVFSYYYFSFLKPKELLLKNENNINNINNKEVPDKQIYFELKKFGYFLFAPTLIYSENYPIGKNNSSRIKNLIINFLNTFLSLILCFLVYEFSLFPYFKRLSNEYVTAHTIYNINQNENLFQIFFHFTYNTFLIFNLIFYGFIHSYHNFFADIIGFSDRKFYDDFWKSSTPLELSKKVGLIAYELLVYGVKPFLIIHMNFSKIMTKIICFVLVSVCIEFLVYFTINLFFPISTFMFVLGYISSLLLKKFKSDKVYLASLMVTSFGMGSIVFCLFYQLALSKIKN